jgi:ADP-ribosylglycohydrolase
MDLNRVKGVIYGHAIGDALGRLTEFMSLSEIKSKYLEDLTVLLGEKKAALKRLVKASMDS